MVYLCNNCYFDGIIFLPNATKSFSKLLMGRPTNVIVHLEVKVIVLFYMHSSREAEVAECKTEEK